MAIDIETLGLLDKRPLPDITCVCGFDGEREYSFLFHQVSFAEKEANKEKLIDLLDSADRLLGFNIVFFDLEFIKRSFGVSNEKMSEWVRKSVDPFMFLKYVAKQTSNMSSLLALNDLPSKTGSGAHAITLALEGNVAELLQYCLMDAKLVYRLCHLDVMKFENADSRVMGVTNEFMTSGKWTIHSSEEKLKRKIVCKSRGFSSPESMPVALHHLRAILVNPEVLDWIQIL